MANIYGAEIKSLKGFTGMEGYCFQGNVYLNGKKLGFWSQDSHGGCDDYCFDERLLREAAQKHFDSQPEDWKYRYLYEKEDGTMDDSYIDTFMWELSALADDEKTWKRHAKKGFPIMVHFHSAPDPKYPDAVPLTRQIFVHEAFLGRSDKDILKVIERDCNEKGLVIERIYRSPEDFVVK